MVKSGLIKRFVPVLSADSAGGPVQAMVNLKVDPSATERVAEMLARLSETRAVFVTADQGLSLRVALRSVGELQTFLKGSVLGRCGVVGVTSTQIVSKVVKDEPPSLARESVLPMDLKCDYCAGEVAGSRPYTLSAGISRYYFCCKTCRKAYLEKFGERLAKIRRGAPPGLRLQS